MILSLLFCLSVFASDLKLNELEPKLDAFVQNFQPVENTGIAIGVVQDGKLVFFKGYGYRDRENKLPVTEHTVFAIGSATKTFVSTSLAMLQEEGKVDFERPIRSFLPGFALESPEASAQANLVDLLSHQIGLPRHDLLWYYTPFTTQEIFSKLGRLEMDKRPGMGFRSGKMQYNNLMFMTAGLLMARVSGSSWQEFVKERIMSPLGMRESSFSLDGFDVENAARPYAAAERLPYHPVSSVSAAGAINSTVADLAKWVDFHLSRGKGLVRPESLENLYRQRSDGSVPERGIEMGYGLGMMVGSVDGQRVIYHGGNIDGFTAHVSFAPELGIGLVVLVNQNNASTFEFPMKVRAGNGGPVPLLPYIVYDHFLQNLAFPSRASPREVKDALAPLLLPELKSLRKASVPEFIMAAPGGEAYSGNFAEPAYGDLSVFRGQDGTLCLNYYGHVFGLETGDESGKFWLDSRQSGISVDFELRDGSVNAVNVLFEAAVKPIHFVRIR